MIGEFRKHLDEGLSFSPAAVQIHKTRAIDTGDEAKYFEVNQAIAAGAYEQPCRLFNSSVRFGIFWGWSRVCHS